MTQKIQLDLEYCLRQLTVYVHQKYADWGIVKDQALLAKIAINKALGTGNVYSKWLVQTLDEATQSDHDATDPMIAIRLVNLVDAATQAIALKDVPPDSSR